MKTRSFSLLVLTHLTKVAFFVLCISKGAIAWQSSEDQPDDTHRRVARHAAYLLHENVHKHEHLREYSEVLLRNIDRLEDGAVAPDFETETPYYVGASSLCKRFGKTCKVQSLYNDHFYDADTHKGLNLSSVFVYNSSLFKGPLGDDPPENAESQTRRYAGIAIATWKEARRSLEAGRADDAEALFAESIYWLGYASHYFSDIFEPHHAANYPWGPLNKSHSDFEKKVDARLDAFLPQSDIAPKELDYAAAQDPASVYDFITQYADTYATVAKSHLQDCIHGYFSWFPRRWDDVAQKMLRANRDVLSLFYYRFLREAAETDAAALEALPVGRFNVEIGMGEGFVPFPGSYHPAEEIRFRVDFEDGDFAEWILDTDNFYRWYAFGTDVSSSYFLNWGDELQPLKNVSSVHLSRGDGWGDPWEIDSLEIFIHGHRVLRSESTMLLATDDEISIPTGGGLSFEGWL